ncbi:HAMP domain-containing sensor histidine kinase [uncultured Tateyamaria sp.]|uniref:sensor histidine kinase n=1 Tax=uncultured Tateyamaria sp. TaxID=455651 RepID=UPI00260C5347|nr:HAMP domain-containing sensor histidine kinase [uncultured Tateyamaria sp.]
MLPEIAMISAEAGCTWEALVAHQLRAPLAALTQKLKPGQTIATEDVTPDVRRMLRLIDQLQVSGSCTPDAAASPEPFNLRTLTRNAAAMLTPLALARGQSLQLRDVASHDRLALGKAPLVSEAIANLIGNAIKYAPRNSRIDLVTMGGSDIYVLDRGTGLSGKDATRVFNPFVRGRNAADDEGSGLGLYLVKRIADLSHGTVGYMSRKGGGAVFRLHLPLA